MAASTTAAAPRRPEGTAGICRLLPSGIHRAASVYIVTVTKSTEAASSVILKGKETVTTLQSCYLTIMLDMLCATAKCCQAPLQLEHM